LLTNWLLKFPLSPSESIDHATSTFASVFKEYVSTDALALWSKVHDSNVLSQLRSKYWGNKIEVEAQQWRDSHPIADEITSEPMNDIGQDCHVLDFDIKVPGSKFWVRQDYVRIYDYCKRHVLVRSPTELSRSVVITGSPGIGEFLSLASCTLITLV
jgi:hypothetical protein